MGDRGDGDVQASRRFGGPIRRDRHLLIGQLQTPTAIALVNQFLMQRNETELKDILVTMINKGNLIESVFPLLRSKKLALIPVPTNIPVPLTPL